VVRFTAKPDGTGSEIFDPAAGSLGAWRPGSSTAGFQPRYPIVLKGSESECGRACGKVLVYLKKGPTQAEPDWQIYDPKTKSWSAAAAPAFARSIGATATLLTGPKCAPNCGKVLVAGGIGGYDETPVVDNRQTTMSAEIYDPKANSWSLTAPLSTGRMYHAAVALTAGKCGANCGKVLLVGGGSRCRSHQLNSCEGAEGSAELFDPATAKFSAVAKPGFARPWGHTATQLGSGEVLVTSGESTQKPSSPEIWDPSRDTWLPAGTCVCPAFHAAARLPGGEILVVGKGSAEYWDPKTSAWKGAGSMKAVRAGDPDPAVGPTVVVLSGSGCGSNCGKALVVGGRDPEGKPLLSAEFYSLDEAGSRTAIAGQTKPNRLRIPLMIAGGVILMIALGLIVAKKTRSR